MPDTEHDSGREILRTVLDDWQAGIDAHDPDRVSAVFTGDAVFQGLAPYTVGRDGVRRYYDGQPPGMTVSYRIDEVRRPAEQVVLGYGTARFSRPDGTEVDLMLGVAVTRTEAGWRIQQYQVSPPPQ
ncbi:SgcJ/EcaC family oxidoreductase [Mycolicibacterium sp. 018/SC-01/001]|uniref:YybH family protein n=1 Tax=Mycolicibacterium sp. 018/SC-01/001 TaxID=2592069 RepID=UPI00117DD92B|nr:SgcJ/EcaC family oxidoreductase [Mycolicibacterium sp. 018/SC-01/001]TRW85501.1 SgcJ/EcaC family oxidoreductase [Mycolicibacterium sp. 018/SC-01/001]